jgi:Methyl coenzyme M reductase, beta subunit
MELATIKNLLESGRINFLFGSGLSLPYLSTLESIEERLTELNSLHEKDEVNVVKSSIYRQYFAKVIWPNHNEVIEHLKGKDKDKYDKVLHNYTKFLETMNLLVAKRHVFTKRIVIQHVS